jgi:hypothetical protein
VGDRRQDRKSKADDEMNDENVPGTKKWKDPCQTMKKPFAFFLLNIYIHFLIHFQVIENVK